MPFANSHKFFSNTACKYFPCHEVDDIEQFNCMFCYCPLYLLGKNCGGNFEYTGKNNKIKSCMNCTLPHSPNYYDTIMEKLKEVANDGSTVI